jgi:hypothetical protein
MRDTGLKQKKAEALYSVFKKGLDEGRFDSLFKAGRWCAQHPAPRYFISAKRASVLIGRLLNNDILAEQHPSTRRMALELFKEYKRFMAENPGNTQPRMWIMEYLIEQPAPEFFLTPDAARKMLNKEIKRRRRMRRW